MKDTCYLVLNESGVKRMTKKPPSLQGDERCVAVAVKVDDSIFTYSFMKTELTIGEDDVIEPSMEVQLLHLNKKL
ncbi:MAG: hypothetical protein KJO69_04735 [Gammaproteobacteria bacterium]|nr:hypothetical protein [Gammaproteobacteria bacterium]